MRLIDADGLRELLDGGYDIDLDELPETKAELLRMIDYQETVDAEPVRHGRWEFDGESNTGIYALCSVCGESIYQCGMWYYCPNCGARMDEEVEK